MDTIEDLVTKQDELAVEINKAISTIKKTPKDRRTVEYYNKKASELATLWEAFEKTDNLIRRFPKIPEDHIYFKSGLYEEIGNRHATMQDEIEGIIKGLRASTSIPPSLQPTTQGLVMKQQTVIGTVNKMLEELLVDSSTRTNIYMATKLTQIEAHINTMQQLHNKICAADIPYDLEQYLATESSIWDKLMRAKEIQQDLTSTPLAAHRHHLPQRPLAENQQQSPLHLPKVTIPKFDGDYLKWRQFYDLFSEMVDKQPIPAIQKMFYLKSNLSGEAEHLISQFSLSETNYVTAWKTLQERYNNKRILVANLVEKIIYQQAVNSSAQSIKALHDTTKECLLALNNLGIATSTWDAILIQIMMKKLDKNTHIRYMQSLTNPKDVPKISELLSFLELQFQSMEAIVPRENHQTHKAVATVTSVTSNNIGTCKFCNNSGHKLYHCNKFRQLSEAERLRWVQGQNLCVNCFGSGHTAKSCKSGNCRKCEKKHNTLLHLEKQHTSSSGTQSTTTNSKAKKTPPTTNVVAVTATATNIAAGRQGYVLLATAKVIMTASNGVSNEFKAVLDSGSQVNLVSKRLCQRLSISPSEASLCLDCVGETQRKSKYRINIGMKSRDLKFSANVEAYVLPSIIPAQPSQHIDISTWDIPNNIHLADPQFHQQEKIDLLLGAEFYYKLTKNGTIHLADDLPTLQNTELGWIVGGAIGKNPIPNPLCALTCAIFGNTNSLEDAIENLWKLDEIEGSEKVLSPSEKQCESHFTQHVHNNKDGRFIVSLPFRENPTALGESHAMAYNRFIGLERRLLKNKEIQTQYTKFMQEYEQLGHMQKVDIQTALGPKYIIPHHCVLKPDSTTTKLRVVFDASAKTPSGHSLNDLMYTGPTVQSELFSILLRFRLPKFVFTTDIEKMYRQILVHPDDQKYQLIIWREDPSHPINYYKLNTVTYGTRSAPYLATRCLQKIADENSINYPYGSEMLKNNFYVDDGLGGSDSLNIALETQKELITILKRHGFNLRKWCANHPQLLKNIPLGDQEVDLDFNNDNTNTIKTLGLLWLPKTDQFCVKVKINHLQIVSKRTATSDLARLFDPLGLLAPVVVKAKMFIQQLWQFKLDWDEPLAEDLHEIWAKFRNDLDSLNNFKIPRHIFKGELPAKSELHIFSDASEKAFGAVAYIRATLKDGRIVVQLLCAKTRVAPLKQQTLPRLELCAAVMAAQLVNRIKTDLQIKNQLVFLWTDSEIVLSWINTQSSLYNTFVANRVSKIQSLTLAEQWRHVRSKDNPADVLSRGLAANKLSGCHLWFFGPLFLHGRKDMWPPKFSRQLQNGNDVEKRKTTVTSAINISNDDIIYKIQHKNSFRTLQRILGYTLRFVRNSRIKPENRPTHISLTPAELDDALFLIIRTIQISDFSPEIKQLQKNREIDRKSSIISLSPFLDVSNILRVGGRLEASLLSYDAKHPMLIPYNDPLTKLLFAMVHEENKHCGPQALLNIIRQRFWPIKGKIMARSTVQKCVRCTKARPQLCQQIMGNLPQTRVTPARPFINAGVDYCGPFWIHYRVRGKRPTKAYIAVFCCFSTKAVHLELVSDLSTEAFIGALKRFIGRRGRCQNIYSDNATNFIGAKNQLSELADSIYSSKAQESIISTSSSKGIHFHFIPPRAPHFGGLWEAAVKSAKHLLLRSVATASLTHEELETVVVEIEAILNSRPLTPITNDPANLEALTPGHFLIGEALTSQVDSRASQLKASGLSHWKQVSHLKQEFWNRWSTEYLNELQQRFKWQKQFVNLKSGDMVIIKEDNVPIMKWPLGRITQVYPGDDGATRVAEVRTSSGLFKRPIHRLAILPVHEDPEPNSTEEPLFHEDEEETPATETLKNKALPTDQGDVVPPKKQKQNAVSSKIQKPIKNSILLTMLITLLLIPVIICSNLQINNFRTDPGLYFEGIGTTKLVTAEWKMMVYYDLTPFSSEIESLSSGIRALQQLCPEIHQQSICNVLINNFEQMKDELCQEKEIFTKHRSKRGAFNIVGNIARSLFGVLDTDYAEEMAKTINQAKIEKEHILQLLKNQTSIIDSTINIIKQDGNRTQEIMNKLLETINQQKEQLNKESQQISKTQLIGILSTHLALIATNLQRTEAEIINVLTDAHNGRISPLLLSPHQLKAELTTIKAHLPAFRALPIDDDNLIQLYKLMNAKGAVTKGEVIFEIMLPLVDQQPLELFKIIPVPTARNQTLIAIIPDSSFIAVNSHRDQYIPFSAEDVTNCINTNPDIYLCKNKQSKLGKNPNINSCDVNIFNNKNTTNCKLVLLPGTSAWTQLHNQNKWIFSIIENSEFSAVCGTETLQATLSGSGIMEIGPTCVMKNNMMTIHGHFGASTNLHTSYANFKQFEAISTPHEIERVVNPTTNKLEIQLNELNQLQQQLNESALLHLPKIIHSNSQHHHAVSYTALILSILFLLGFIGMKLLKRYHQITPKNVDQVMSRPIPRPRPITIDIIDT